MTEDALLGELDFRHKVGENLELAFEAITMTTGKSQAQIARELQVERGRLNNWVRGENLPPPYYLYKLYHLYHVTTDWVYLGVSGELPAKLADGLRVASEAKKLGQQAADRRAP